MEVEKWGKKYYWKVIIIFNKKHFNPTLMLLYQKSEHVTIWTKKNHHELFFILA